MAQQDISKIASGIHLSTDERRYVSVEPSSGNAMGSGPQELVTIDLLPSSEQQPGCQ